MEKKILILYVLVIAIIVVMIVMFSIYCPRITDTTDNADVAYEMAVNNGIAIGQLQEAMVNNNMMSLSTT